jgi:DNA primase
MASGGYAPHLLDEIRSRVDLVDLVGQFVNLKRAGENWKALCPFHAEKTPSFTVNPKRGIFHCFGCGAGGDAFSFLMRQDRLSFPEAVRALAQRAGVDLPSARGSHGTGEPDGKTEALLRAMALAAQFYEEALWSRPEGERARRYLETRGISPDVARRFGVGYAPEGWDHLLTVLTGESIAEEVIVQAGLALPRQTGSGCYDRFRGRLLFPIRDHQARVIAFGGRAMGNEEPKYLNSPETPLYVKGRTLYALDLAKSAMREKNRGLIVEGYVDCLMAHQHGFTETVAALGTAFTPAQLGLLRRYADEVITFFDADAAGQKASSRAEEMMDSFMEIQDLGWTVARTGGFEKPGSPPVKVALLPAGHDPDSFLRAEGAAAFHERIAEARSILSYVMEKALAEEEMATARGRAAAHARAALILSKVPNAAEATSLAREAALRLGVDPTQLWIEAQRLQGSLRAGGARSFDTGATPNNAETPRPSAHERDLMAFLLQVPEARSELLQTLEAEDLTHPGLRALVAALKGRPDVAPETLMAALEGEAERSLLAALLVEERSWADPGGMIIEYRRRYEIRHRLKRIREVSRAIAQAQASRDPSLSRLESELGELQRQAQEVRGLAAARPPISGQQSAVSRKLNADG